MKDFWDWFKDVSGIAIVLAGAWTIVKTILTFFEKRRNSIPIGDQVKQNTKDIKRNSEKIELLTRNVEEIKNDRDMILLEFKMVQITNRELVTAVNGLVTFFMGRVDGDKTELAGLLIQGIGVRKDDKKSS